MSSKNKPIYVVTHKPTGKARLIRASNNTGAVRFVADDTLDVRRPTQDELIKLVGEGTKVEEAAS